MRSFGWPGIGLKPAPPRTSASRSRRSDGRRPTGSRTTRSTQRSATGTRDSAWSEWPADLVRRDGRTLAAARRDLAEEIERHVFGQFLADRQWQALRRHARERGVGIIGDLPIFVAWDSHDVWASPGQFLLDADRRPRAVAGVPPDYFSPTGQLWGNPLYDWEAARKDGYAWWVRRMRRTLELVDLARLDHFRGLQAAWHVPVDSVTAEIGSWEPGPGADLLTRLRTALGGLPLIAEDLGMITPAVHALRNRFDLPGMCVLQFAFQGDPRNPFLPHNQRRNSVVYTGTHDNDTTVGWYRSLTPTEQDQVRVYTNTDGHDIAWDLIRMAWGTVANTAIVPVQDLLLLDTSARMNRPGIADGNWRWRLTPDLPVAATAGGIGHAHGALRSPPRAGTVRPNATDGARLSGPRDTDRYPAARSFRFLRHHLPLAMSSSCSHLTARTK